ncbi:hypothetical protein [Fontibacter flavus]|uniref:Uncharacterized protein n=1 Tax=Fontibacter flavus TaxID=654838 RepID=A0ABV6FU05_9BACT
MKKLLISLFLLTLTIYGGHLLANDESLPGDGDPTLYRAVEEDIVNEAGKKIGTRCISCDPTGSCFVLTCI